MLLAQTLQGNIDVSIYWISEKFDGVRARWDGRELRFRSGRRVPAPPWFIASLPADLALDGELWLGRERFDELSAIVRKASPVDEEWRSVRYLVFELPDGEGSFTDRLAMLQAKLSRYGTAPITLVEQFRLPDQKALAAKLHEVVSAGGEGLMLHRADAAYVTGRSDVLLKVKPWQDAEAVVIAYEPGRGKFRGKLGALRLQMPAEQGGGIFKLSSGLTDAQRGNPPALGSLITYRYTSLTKNGLPRFPRYWRLREEF